MTPPPGKPACQGADPVAFDQTEYQNTSMGLQICAECPVRAWCLETVDPAKSFFDGIAGGHVWVGGTIKWSIPGDEIARNYLERRNISTADQKQYESSMVRQFLLGVADATELTHHERISAARALYRDTYDLTVEQVAERTGLPTSTAYRVISPDNAKTSDQWKTKRRRIEQAQAEIPADRLDHVAISEFVLRQRKWYTLNVTERCFAASQMVNSQGKHLVHAEEIAHVTREQYRSVFPA